MIQYGVEKLLLIQPIQYTIREPGGVMAHEEIRIESRIRNNRLYQAIYSRWPSVAAFCRDEGFSQMAVGQLINLKKSPASKKGGYLPLCKKIAIIFDSTPEFLFPPRLYGLEKTHVIKEISFAELPAGGNELLQLPEETETLDQYDLADAKDRVELYLGHIKQPRTRKALEMRFGIGKESESTLDEIAETLGLSHSRPRQIIQRGLEEIRSIMAREDLFRRTHFLQAQVLRALKEQTSLTGLTFLAETSMGTHVAFVSGSMVGTLSLGKEFNETEFQSKDISIVPRERVFRSDFEHEPNE